MSDDDPRKRRSRLRLVVIVDADPTHSPRELRERFLEAIQESLIRAVGRIDTAVLDEFWRALPREPRQ